MGRFAPPFLFDNNLSNSPIIHGLQLASRLGEAKWVIYLKEADAEFFPVARRAASLPLAGVSRYGTPLELPGYYAGLSDRLFGGSFSLFGEVV